MSKRLYVGNLAYAVRNDALREAFAQVGEVTFATVILERDTGRSKGFGFVEMATEELAQQAIARLNGQMLMGRPISVSEARPMTPRDGGRTGSPHAERR
ncbi:MAG: RNA-binding protein [Anaerolineales bacterium]|nr:RNA-binding protein [Anaerolineales bacterium]